jgi:membrane-associated phospholipid phosphatase
MRLSGVPSTILAVCLVLLVPERGLAEPAPSPPVDPEPASETAIEACSDETAASPEDSQAGNGASLDSDTLKALPAVVLKDAVYVLGSPVRWTGKNWIIAGGAAAGIILVAAMADVAVKDATQSHQSAALDDLTRIVEPFGAEYSWAVLGAYAAVGLIFHDADARDTAIDGIIASLLASGVITPSLKFAFGRARPNATDDPLSFHPFHSGYAALPSGHATQAFAVASVISAHSDKVWVSASAYTLAGLVAFARVYHNAHWTSDVTAGALIGTAVGQGVVALNKRIRSGESRVQILFAPILGERERGAGVTVVF